MTPILFIADTQIIFDRFSFGKKSTIKFVQSISQYNQILNDEFSFDSVIIQTELSWYTNRSIFYGYEIAKQLFNHTKRTSNFSVVFVSIIPREILLRLKGNQNQIFTKVFPHYDLLGENKGIQFPPMSERKFRYLKNYCMVETGILDRLEHTLRSRTIDNIEPFIDELLSNKDLLSPEAINLASNLKDCTIKNEFLFLKVNLQAELLKVKNSFSKSTDNAHYQSGAKVLLLEDQPETAIKIKSQLQPYFTVPIEVYNSGSNALNLLKEYGIDYDVVITDMEILDSNFYDPVQGIDILEYCDNNLLHIVTRIITSLPKNALSQLLQKDFNEIIFKSDDPDFPIPTYERLDEVVKSIDTEIHKRKALRRTPGPVGSWWKVLTRMLYLEKIADPSSYSLKWRTAIDIADKFVEKYYEDNTEKIDTTFRAISTINNNPEDGYQIIEKLLAHRLIVLYTAMNNNYKIDYVSFKTSKSFYESTGTARQYLGTILGIHAKNLDSAHPEILLKNLFPEEYTWLQNCSGNQEVSKDLNLYSYCGGFFILVQKLIIHFPEVSSEIQVDEERTTVEDGVLLFKKMMEIYLDEKRNPIREKTLQKLFNTILYGEPDIPEDIYLHIEEFKQNLNL